MLESPSLAETSKKRLIASEFRRAWAREMTMAFAFGAVVFGFEQ